MDALAPIAAALAGSPVYALAAIVAVLALLLLKELIPVFKPIIASRFKPGLIKELEETEKQLGAALRTNRKLTAEVKELREIVDALRITVHELREDIYQLQRENIEMKKGR